eukprot:GEMP01042202.1.p1 GENE.GEMP01042202.1~~GEMP01042202.1.p1  ORF type:complete len:261 (+),score=44.20 GEMP01042202.1:86-868(+)
MDEEMENWLLSFQEAEEAAAPASPSPSRRHGEPPNKRARTDAKESTNAPATFSSALAVVPSQTDITYHSASIIPFPVKNDERVIDIKAIFSSFYTNCNLNLRQIATKARNAEYNSVKCPMACFIRMRNPLVTGSVYAKGRVAILGAKTLSDAKLGAKKIARLIQRSGYSSMSFAEYKVENVTASFDLGFPVRLESMAIAHRSLCTYEPEVCPSLFYRIPNSKTTLQVWASGKMLITGSKSYDELQEALCVFEPQAAEFQT